MIIYIVNVDKMTITKKNTNNMAKALFVIKESLYNDDIDQLSKVENDVRLASDFLRTNGQDTQTIRVVEQTEIRDILYGSSSGDANVVVIEDNWVDTNFLKDLIELPEFSGKQWVLKFFYPIDKLNYDDPNTKLLLELLSIKQDGGTSNLTILFDSLVYNQNLLKIVYPITEDIDYQTNNIIFNIDTGEVTMRVGDVFKINTKLTKDQNMQVAPIRWIIERPDAVEILHENIFEGTLTIKASLPCYLDIKYFLIIDGIETPSGGVAHINIID